MRLLYLLILVFTISLNTQSQEIVLGPDWGPGGKYESLTDSRNVIFDYALSKTEFFREIAQRQKTALQKLNSEILSKEDLPSDMNYNDIFGKVTLQSAAGYFDNLLEKELGKVPIIGAVVTFGIDTYDKIEKDIEMRKHIISKNTLVEAVNELADQIDDAYAGIFTVKTMNKIADNILSTIGTAATSDRIDYLIKLQNATDNYLSSAPNSDDIYISMIENLLNLLHSKNIKYGLIRIGIDYRNIVGIDKASVWDLQSRQPSNVTIRIVDGPYKQRIMNVVNSLAETRDFSVLKLRVNKYVVCHFNIGGAEGTVRAGDVDIKNQFSLTSNQYNPEIIFDTYYNGYDPTLTGRNMGGLRMPVLAKVKYNALNGQGSPATTTYSQLLTAAYQNIWTNALMYNKFKP